ncbi:MAG: energy transducer TonB [Candidatus Latescibacteria bacterium]|nr:energy transducer TonB [Candidatus Latescibacterota bacterium]
MMIRKKHEGADLKAIYPKVMRRSSALTFVSMMGFAILFPDMGVNSTPLKKPVEVIRVEDIPETQQRKRPPPPPRPAVPIETEDDDVPDDVTIAETDLDFDAPIVDIPPPMVGGGEEDVEEEILEFWAVEEKPEAIHTVKPVYPEMARRAGLQGQVIVSFTVTADGRVAEPKSLKGAEIFRAAALDAVRQFHFRPAMQNDKSVSVRMTIPLSFRLP